MTNLNELQMKSILTKLTDRNYNSTVNIWLQYEPYDGAFLYEIAVAAHAGVYETFV